MCGIFNCHLPFRPSSFSHKCCCIQIYNVDNASKKGRFILNQTLSHNPGDWVRRNSIRLQKHNPGAFGHTHNLNILKGLLSKKINEPHNQLNMLKRFCIFLISWPWHSHLIYLFCVFLKVLAFYHSNTTHEMGKIKLEPPPQAGHPHSYLLKWWMIVLKSSMTLFYSDGPHKRAFLSVGNTEEVHQSSQCLYVFTNLESLVSLFFPTWSRIMAVIKWLYTKYYWSIQQRILYLSEIYGGSGAGKRIL